MKGPKVGVLGAAVTCHTSAQELSDWQCKPDFVVIGPIIHVPLIDTALLAECLSSSVAVLTAASAVKEGAV
jgi:hypothetical protein